MKKPFSIVDAALNVIRVCLAAGILITLFDFFTRIDQTPAIVIRFPKSAETEETSGYEPEYTAGTQIIQKSRGYKKPELLTEEPEPENSAIAENETETEPILISTERETVSEASANYAAEVPRCKFCKPRRQRRRKPLTPPTVKTHLSL